MDGSHHDDSSPEDINERKRSQSSCSLPSWCKSDSFSLTQDSQLHTAGAAHELPPCSAQLTTSGLFPSAWPELGLGEGLGLQRQARREHCDGGMWWKPSSYRRGQAQPSMWWGGGYPSLPAFTCVSKSCSLCLFSSVCHTQLI